MTKREWYTELWEEPKLLGVSEKILDCVSRAAWMEAGIVLSNGLEEAKA